MIKFVRNTSKRLFVVAILALLIGFGKVSAQGYGYGNTPQAGDRAGHLLAPLLPGIATAGAPEWLRPGMRVTFFSAAATTQNQAGQSTLRPDPNGELVNPRTGERFSMSQVSQGTGGAGFTQLNVVAADPEEVVLDVRSYLITSGLQGPPTLSAYGAVIAQPAATDWWINPAVLQRLANTNRDGLFIGRMPYELGGWQYQGVFIQVSNQGGFTSYVYDEASGVLLSQSTSQGVSAEDLLFTPDNFGGGSYRRGATSGSQMTITRFVGARQLDLPWSGGPPPTWVTGVRGFHYEGTQNTARPLTGNIPLPVAVDIAVTRRGSNWIEYQQRNYSGTNVPDSTPPVLRVAGPDQIGGLWIAPGALVRLHPGQVIDEDPITGVRTFVDQVGRDGAGRDVVVISERSELNLLTYTYDRSSGVMLDFEMVNNSFTETQTTITTTVDLAGSY